MSRRSYAVGINGLSERAYPNLIHYNKVAKGGHFPASEQPQLFAEELRTGFKSLRA
jgi:hypothetical protein